MESIWGTAAIWVGMALVATLISVRLGVSVALVEICVGVAGGNLFSLEPTAWITFLAAVGSVLHHFGACGACGRLAQVDIDDPGADLDALGRLGDSV